MRVYHPQQLAGDDERYLLHRHALLNLKIFFLFMFMSDATKNAVDFLIG